jgi:hypothetical protein
MAATPATPTHDDSFLLGLLALGYPLRDAAYLALSDVDLHEIERLIDHGCTAETAVRIAG